MVVGAAADVQPQLPVRCWSRCRARRGRTASTRSSSTRRTRCAFEVNGQPGMANNTLIEGLDDNQKTGLLQVIIPAADALETVSVTTSNYDAEFGRSGGAVTNVTLKSGTNDLKGSAFFFGNNEKTNASDYFTHLKAPTKFVNGGFTLGGPIVKNKLFFFGDYQRTIDNNGYVVRATVPTAGDAQRRLQRGDATASTIRRPATSTARNRAAFANNQIPQDRISPIAQQAAGVHSRCRTSPARARPEQLPAGADAREDHRRLRREGQLHGRARRTRCRYRLSFMRPVVFDPGLVRSVRRAGQRRLRRHRHEHQLQHAPATWTRVFSAKTVLDVRGGLNYYHNVTATTGQRADDEHGRRHSRARTSTSSRAASRRSASAATRIRCSASRPASRGIGPRRPGTSTATLTKLMNNAHGQARRRVAAQPRHAAADAGRRRPARPLRVQRRRAPASRAKRRRLSGVANSFASFLLDWPNTVQRDLKVIDQPGTKHTGRRSRSSRTSGRCART